MKKLLLILLLASVASICYGQFRNTTWGMSLEEVIAIEALGEVTRFGEKGKLTYAEALEMRHPYSIERLSRRNARTLVFHFGEDAMIRLESVLLLGYVCYAQFNIVNGELSRAYYGIPSAAYDRVYNALRERFGSPSYIRWLGRPTVWVDGRTEIRITNGFEDDYWMDRLSYGMDRFFVVYTDNTRWARVLEAERERKADESPF